MRMNKSWIEKAVIYQLMVDRFSGGRQDTSFSLNDFCGGTIRGIIDRLDYIKALGCNAIMLSPVFKTEAYHGYHTLDYDEIDPHFGDWDGLKMLIEKAHAMGMNVLLDFVPNHCSYWNPVFQAALLSNGGKNRSWFFFQSDDSDDFTSFMNFPGLPKFNLETQAAAEFMVLKAERLARLSIDGLRIDHAVGLPFSFLNLLRARLKVINPNLVLIGEAWAENVSEEVADQLYLKKGGRCSQKTTFSNMLMEISATVLGKDVQKDSGKTVAITQEEVQCNYIGILDGVFDFNLLNIILKEVRNGHRIKGNLELRDKVARHFKCYPHDFKLVLFLDNHDTNRFLYECGGDVTLLEETIDFLKELNRPFVVYYGTEQLMTHERNVLNTDEPYADLQVRQCMDWRKAPVDILRTKPTTSQNDMPIINGKTWSGCTPATEEKEEVMPRLVADNDELIWLETDPTWILGKLMSQNEVITKLAETAAFIKNKEKIYGQWGLRRTDNGKKCTCINLYGPPGTGKSISAEAIAHISGRKVIKASYSQIQSDRWGGTEKMLTSLFEKAERTGAFIILNEADALFSRRRSGGANSETNNQIKSHLLNLMDEHDVVLILTTNRFQDYDEAFYRRTIFHVEVPLPGYEERVKLWKMHLGCAGEEGFFEEGVIPKADNFSFENLAKYSEGLSGGDIRRITLSVAATMACACAGQLSEDTVIAAVKEYLQGREMMQTSELRPVTGKRKEELLNVMSKERNN